MSGPLSFEHVGGCEGESHGRRRWRCRRLPRAGPDPVTLFVSVLILAGCYTVAILAAAGVLLDRDRPLTRKMLVGAIVAVILAAQSAYFVIERVSAPSSRRIVEITAPGAAALVHGSAFVQFPSEATQYESFAVALVVVANPRAVVAAASSVGLTPRMRAELLGADFDVDEKGLREQAVNYLGETTWTWHVKSDWPGTRSLHVRVDALTNVAGRETPRMYDVAEPKVKIRASPWEFVERNWQWAAGIATTVLAGIFGILFRKKKPD